MCTCAPQHDGREFALKKFRKSDVKDENANKEIDILMNNQHINIVKFIDSHDDLHQIDAKAYEPGTKGIFMEYVRPGFHIADEEEEEEEGPAGGKDNREKDSDNNRSENGTKEGENMKSEKRKIEQSAAIRSKKRKSDMCTFCNIFEENRETRSEREKNEQEVAKWSEEERKERERKQKERRKRKKQKNMEIGLPLCYQLIKCVEFLHDRGIAHRDIKPQNILVAVSDGRPPIAKLIDFGCAITQPIGRATELGTVIYKAPETQRKGEEYRADKADIWSIGCTVFAVLNSCQLMDEREVWLGAPFFRRMKAKSGEDNLNTMLGMTDAKREDLSKEEVSFYEKIFEGDSSKRPTAAQLLDDDLFESVADRVEAQIYLNV